MKCPKCGAELNIKGVCEYCGYSRIPISNTIERKNSNRRKTWLWVLGWILFFPIPITILILRKSNWAPAVRYALVAGLWILIIISGIRGNQLDYADIDSNDVVNQQSVQKESRDAEGYNDVQCGGLLFNIPTYFIEDSSMTDNESKLYYAETGQQVSMLQLNEVGEEMSDEEFKESINEFFSSIMTSLQDNNAEKILGGKITIIENDEGLISGKMDFSMSISGVDMDGAIYLINNPYNRKVVSAVLYQSVESEYIYFDSVEKMIKEARVEKA